MAFAIMRAAKLKQGNLNASLKHCFRTIETTNADASLTPQNEHFEAENEAAAVESIKSRLPQKRRKDAVVAVEYLMTASPEWFKQANEAEQEEFFAKSMEWLSSKYGAENVAVATVHRDETTPHLSAFVTPITKDGRLSAKEFIGNKTLMSDDQTSYAKAVEGLGLERGIKKSKAKHKDLKTYYGELNETIEKAPRIKAQDLEPRSKSASKKWGFGKEKETAEEVAQRLDKSNRKLIGGLQNALDNSNKRIKSVEAIASRADALKFENSTLASEVAEWETRTKEMIQFGKEHFDKAVKARKDGIREENKRLEEERKPKHVARKRERGDSER